MALERILEHNSIKGVKEIGFSLIPGYSTSMANIKTYSMEEHISALLIDSVMFSIYTIALYRLLDLIQ